MPKFVIEPAKQKTSTSAMQWEERGCMDTVELGALTATQVLGPTTQAVN